MPPAGQILNKNNNRKDIENRFEEGGDLGDHDQKKFTVSSLRQARTRYCGSVPNYPEAAISSIS